jgi:nucleolar GTP-binding protein
VSPPEELLVSALKRAARVGPSPTAAKSGGGEAAKERSRAARQLDALMKELSVPLGRYVSGFPPAPAHLMAAAADGNSGGNGGGGPRTTTPRRSSGAGGGASLHPFDAALLDLTVAGGARGYASSLSRVDALRKLLQQTGKAFAGRAASAPNAAAAKALLEEGTAELSRLFQKNSGCVRDLAAAARRLRRLPQVDPRLPTVALVGAPNVGKSSLVKVLSSGAPTVCDYPFTTRSVALGHFFAPGPPPLDEEEDEDEEEGGGQEGDAEAAAAALRRRRQRQQSRPLRRHQVTDTPGLLDREDPERNAMERLTLACVAHLPGAAVLFVADLTEGCGASVAQQWRVRRRLRGQFPGRAWVDVLSKGDLLEPWEGEGEGADGAVGGGGGGGVAGDGASASALALAAAEAERAVEAAERPIGQRGGAREYERAVRLALACRLRADQDGGYDHKGNDASSDGGGASSSTPGSSPPPPPPPPPLSPPLAVVRVSTLTGPQGLDELKRAVLGAIAWAERREEEIMAEVEA